MSRTEWGAIAHITYPHNGFPNQLGLAVYGNDIEGSDHDGRDTDMHGADGEMSNCI